MKNIVLILVIAVIVSCQTKNEGVSDSLNHFSDPVLVQIEEYQDKRDSENLVVFFSDENPIYRAAAAEAFASIQDSTSIEKLSELLNDKDVKVRKFCAYALGQMYHEEASKKLKNQLDIEDSVAVRKVLWEALGKCITKEKLEYFTLAQIDDPLELEGYSWGIYRIGVRGVYNDTLVNIAANLLYPEYTFETRFAAAHFLSRTRNINISNHLDSIIGSAIYDKSPFVRMASANALRNDKSDKTIQAISKSIVKDHDYRVRINALRAMNSYELVDFQEVAFSALFDENVNVAITAATLLKNRGHESITKRLVLVADSIENWRVRSQLLGAALKINFQDEQFIEKIKSKYLESTNNYEKAELLTMLSNSFLAYEFIVTETFSEKAKVISTSGINALANLRAANDFPDELSLPLADVFKQAILSGDLAMIGVATSTISNPDYNYRSLYDTVDFLYQAKNKLELPKDNEGMQTLQAAIDFFEENDSVKPVKNKYNHPINWELVKTIPSRHKMRINTEKGSIIMEMLVEDAPGSVANFIELVRKGYYNGKKFHRVVPNFVAQGGCNRGDGWGGEDYSIRSEFAPIKYSEGYIGMASAGKDTEGTQWFITHSPTPHLDGRYTIFARVYEGMDIVHELEIGDEIISVEEL
ncbi:MAG: peptidylprolyl isomerase [Cyclobacteriaceae bacterium]|nr:peptidylprolyl isomerase [Cyclobacteriaceae bacterium]